MFFYNPAVNTDPDVERRAITRKNGAVVKESTMLIKDGVLLGIDERDGNSFYTLKIPEDVIEIADDACRETRITGVEMHDHVKKIGARCFRGSFIKEISFPASVTALPVEVCASCENLRAVHIPTSVRSIAKSAFGNCAALSAVKYAGTYVNWHTLVKADPCWFLNSRKVKLITVGDGRETSFMVPGGLVPPVMQGNSEKSVYAPFFKKSGDNYVVDFEYVANHRFAVIVDPREDDPAYIISMGDVFDAYKALGTTFIQGHRAVIGNIAENDALDVAYYQAPFPVDDNRLASSFHIPGQSATYGKLLIFGLDTESGCARPLSSEELQLINRYVVKAVFDGVESLAVAFFYPHTTIEERKKFLAEGSPFYP